MKSLKNFKNEIDSSASPPHNDTAVNVILSEAKNLVVFQNSQYEIWMNKIKKFFEHRMREKG